MKFCKIIICEIYKTLEKKLKKDPKWRSKKIWKNNICTTTKFRKKFKYFLNPDLLLCKKKNTVMQMFFSKFP